MKLVETLHGDVVVGLGKPPGDVPVERVGKDLVGRPGIGRIPADEGVPRLAHVEHGRVELTFRAHPGICERLVGYPAGHVSQAPDPEGVCQAARRVDGENEHPASEARGRRGGERGRDRRLAHPPRSADDDDLLRRQELLQVTRLLLFSGRPGTPGDRTAPGT